MTRAIKETFTLSDGTVLPKDAVIGVISNSARDPQIYPEPEKFDPYRFARLREKSEDSKWRFESTSAEYLGFGHGSHSCPGRWLAADIIKIAFAQLILRYDWKFPDGQGRPTDLWLAHVVVPFPTTKIMFKARSLDMKSRSILLL
jgi:cytochrome P450